MAREFPVAHYNNTTWTELAQLEYMIDISVPFAPPPPPKKKKKKKKLQSNFQHQ